MANACYLSYYGMSESLLWSQGIPYLHGVAKKTGITFYIVSFEKPELLNKPGVKKKIETQLNKINLKWYALKYHKSMLGKLWDIFIGNFITFYLFIFKKVYIFHPRGTMGYTFILFIKYFKKIKILYDLRGIMAEEYVDAGSWSKNSLKYKTVKKIEEDGLIRADAVVVLSKKIKNMLVNDHYYSNSLPPHKIEIIYCAVDHKKFTPTDSFGLKKKLGLEKKIILIYLGSIGTWYLFDEMLDFFSCFKDKYSEAHFLIVSHSHKLKILKKIKEKNISSTDITIIHSEPEEVPDYINLADLGISFIKPCISKKASSPTKLGEYLACGLPVIINSGIGDSDSIVKNNKVGLVVDNFTLFEYKEKIKKLGEIIGNSQIKQAARKTAIAEFSLDDAVNQYEYLYKKILIAQGYVNKLK